MSRTIIQISKCYIEIKNRTKCLYYFFDYQYFFIFFNICPFSPIDTQMYERKTIFFQKQFHHLCGLYLLTKIYFARIRFQIDHYVQEPQEAFLWLRGWTFYLVYRSSHRRYSVKKVFLKNSQISQENSCIGVSFQWRYRHGSTISLKRDSSTGVFFWNLQNF